ncbi:MAG: TlpA family protein disulfide reductase [Acidobacteria bacterium]|nr:TlpA family protein disulfide reductase [Acidobacteriota bacterium]
MRLGARCLVVTFLTVVGPLWAGGITASNSDAEARVLAYVREHTAPDRPLRVTDLYNNIFTQPDERRALDKLYRAFFRIPLFVAQYQAKFGVPPKLEKIAEQFDLKSPQDAGTLLLVMESDPRVPRFIERDAKTGEITRVDEQVIRSDRRFAEATEKHLSGWEGTPAPDVTLPGLDSPDVTFTGLRGKTVLLYVWFTGCPPCMKQTPELVAVDRELAGRGLMIVAANADKLLGLGYGDEVRRRYRTERKIAFPMADWTRDADTALGSVSIFPTLFLIDSKGIIVQNWVGFTRKEILESAVTAALSPPTP